MQYFLVCDLRGVVLYEEGRAPQFRDVLLRSLDRKCPYGKKRVRDDEIEYAIRGDRLYLSVNDAVALLTRVEQLETWFVKAKEFEKLNLSKIKIEEANKTKEEQTSTKKKNKEKEILDYSVVNAKLSINEELDGKPQNKLNLKRVFKLFTGQIDIKEIGMKMKNHLIGKNVDPIYAETISEGVLSECRDLGTETINEKEFKKRVIDVIGKLIPLIDHSTLIKKIKEHAGLFTICFVGVNGVGKSTSLAKITKWLLDNKLRVYVAACDTFRAGAIEQLRIHVDRFKKGGYEVGFFNSGYAKDDAAVAQAAAERAIKNNYDVLLVDTAGRMHNKENMMRNLSKLIAGSKPNHILFVGEALVGGDSLKHIREFNKSIGMAGGQYRINSILLTKVDTVDDKIGQIVNLSFSASAPILFLGTGQGNSDLIEMDPKAIGELLVS